MMRLGMFAILALFAATQAQAQSITNNDIVNLVASKVSDDVIVQMIKSTPQAFDTSANAIVALKSKGVSDRIIAEMIIRKSGQEQGVPATAAPVPRTGAVAATRTTEEPSGIYAQNMASPTQARMPLRAETANSARMANPFVAGFTFGMAKTKLKAELPGAASDFVTGRRPTFDFVFDVADTSFSAVRAAAASPRDFYLMKLKVDGNKREMVVGSVGLGGAVNRLSEKDSLPFNVETVSATRYRVTVPADLQAGEYAFVLVTADGRGGGGVANAYSFSVR